jgi:hypothetical protein
MTSIAIDAEHRRLRPEFMPSSDFLRLRLAVPVLLGVVVFVVVVVVVVVVVFVVDDDGGGGGVEQGVASAAVVVVVVIIGDSIPLLCVAAPVMLVRFLRIGSSGNWYGIFGVVGVDVIVE